MLRALVKNYKMLFSTFAFMVILIYSFSFLMAERFPREWDGQTVGTVQPCDTFTQCFVYNLNMGMRFGGGIADGLDVLEYGESHFAIRNVFDVSYFVLINVVLLNIIFGLIIDAFAELRDENTHEGKPISFNSPF